jgi:hypothetical protein
LRLASFWDRAEAIWNDSRALAWILVLAGISLALWVGFYPKSPGVSIGLLAGAAGIMSVRPKMHPAEKFAWVAVLVAFTILEVLAIKVSDQRNEDTRKAQNAAFGVIAEGLRTSIAASKGQYDSTIGHVDGVLKTTQSVASLAKSSLENITGGDSYAYMYPDFIEGQNDSLDWKIHNFGQNPLSGVTVKIRPIKGGSLLPFGRNDNSIVQFGPSDVMDIGTLPPDIGQSISRLFRPASLSYQIFIQAQNGITDELLFLRPSKNSYAYKLEVWTKASGKRHKGDVLVNVVDSPSTLLGEWMRRRVYLDWTEPSRLLQ